MKRRVLIGGGVVAVLVLTSAVLVWRHDEDEQTKAPVKVGGSNVVVTDFAAPAIKDVQQQQSDPLVRYKLLVSYALSKESFQKYDEAVAYYKAAAAEKVDATKQQSANYHIYRIAKVTKNTALLTQYKTILGQTVIDSYENQGKPDDAQPK